MGTDHWEVLGMSRPPFEEVLIDMLGAGPLELEELLARFPKADQNRAIVAIDGLSRQGLLLVRLHRRPGYQISIRQPLAAASSLKLATVADWQTQVRGMSSQPGLGALAGTPMTKSIQ